MATIEATECNADAAWQRRFIQTTADVVPTFLAFALAKTLSYSLLPGVSRDLDTAMLGPALPAAIVGAAAAAGLQWRVSPWLLAVAATAGAILLAALVAEAPARVLVIAPFSCPAVLLVQAALRPIMRYRAFTEALTVIVTAFVVFTVMRGVLYAAYFGVNGHLWMSTLNVGVHWSSCGVMVASAYTLSTIRQPEPARTWAILLASLAIAWIAVPLLNLPPALWGRAFSSLAEPTLLGGTLACFCLAAWISAGLAGHLCASSHPREPAMTIVRLTTSTVLLATGLALAVFSGGVPYIIVYVIFASIRN